jgi:alanine-glyoxylate transaminase/serine-glyoxylate transaminase/serine-pyruvate transaminase
LPITSIYALREAIALVHLEGLERRWKRHKNAAEYLRMKLDGLGMEMFVAEKVKKLKNNKF